MKMRLVISLLFAVSVVFAQSRVHLRRNIDEIQLDCARLVDGNYPNPSEKCSQFFATCDNGLVLTRNCPADTYYDEVVDDCAEKNFVRACGGKLPDQDITQLPSTETVTERPQEIVETTTAEHIFFNCAGLRPGNYPNPAAKDGCSPIFFSCGAARRPHLMRCPGRTYYDDEIDLCNYFSDVPKCSGVPRPTSSTSEPGVSSTPLPPDPFDCTRLPDGNYAPPKEETICPEYFFQCANRRGFRVNCPSPGLRYDLVQDACVTPFEVAGCADEVANDPHGFN